MKDLENINIKIIGTGSELPKNVQTNKDIEKLVETSDEWIVERTGISQRHIVGDSNETVATLGAKAALKAINMANISPEDIDLILVATCSHKEHVPSASCEVQELIGAVNAAAFDIGAACTGFMTALSVADAYLKTGAFNKILVIGSEVLSGIVDYTDRGTCILFGDGAGACVVERGNSCDGMTFVLGADGTGKDALKCECNSTITMDGQAVYRFATSTVPKVINDALDKAKLSADDIDIFLLHQANSRIISSIAKRLKQDINKFPMNLNNVGNMSSASIPVLLDEQVRNGRIVKGDRIVMSGFGAGLTYGALVMKWE